MIFWQPFIFIADFLGHMLVIVLAGFVITECIACYADLKAYRSGRMDERGGSIFRIRRRDHLLILSSVIIFALWLIVEYFIDIDSALYHFSFHWTSVFAILFLLSRLSYWRGTRRLTLLFGALVGTALAHVALDVPHVFWQSVPYDRLLRAALKILEAFSLYFFVVVYAIVSKTPAYAESALRARVWTRADFARWGGSALAALIGLVLIYSAVPEHNKMNHQAPDAPPTEVTVRLKWIPQAQFAGMYVADQKGHYKDENLAVSLLPFDYEHYPVDDVVNGYGTFGIAGADEILVARAQGKPVVALATILQRSPVVITVPADSDIHSVEDLRGKRVGMWGLLDDAFVDGDYLVLETLLRGKNMHIETDIKPVFVGFKGVDALMSGDVDAFVSYVTDEPILLEARGFPVRNLALYDKGIVFYGDVLFTHEDVIRDTPELVRSFVKATLRGWEYAALSEEEGVDATMRYEQIDPYGPLSREHETAVLDTSLPLIKPLTVTRIGEMNSGVWQTMYVEIQKTGAFESEFDVREAYTTRFLPF